MLYVYAFAEAPARIPDVRGIDEAPLAGVAIERIEAVVSEHETAVDSSEDAVLAHAGVVEAVGEANEGVLPARFGGMYVDAAALRESIRGRTELGEALERVRDAAELAVRVLVERTGEPRPSTGSDYMRVRLERRRETERLAEAVHGPLARLARDSTSAVGATPRLLLTAAYLVDRDRVPTFRDAVAALQAEHPELGIVCTGPWPPYSFATAERGTT